MLGGRGLKEAMLDRMVNVSSGVTIMVDEECDAGRKCEILGVGWPTPKLGPRGCRWCHQDVQSRLAD